MAFTFLQLAKKILSEEKRPLSYTEMWNIAVERGHDKLVGSTGKTPWQSLGALLYVDVRDNPNSIFMTIGERPKRFILKKQYDSLKDSHSEFIEEPEAVVQKYTYQEKDLHPLMVYYGSLYMKAYLKTIRHNLSGKKSYGEWVHPDIVGCYFPFADWDSEVVEVSSLLGNSAIKLYSFELKKVLSFSNLRESFFQAVSNSSWANEAYLVAAEIEKDDEFMNELRRLSTAFGIGVIELNVEDPDSCETILPPIIKDIVDWDTVNKLASMNSDFKKFLRRIKIDMNSREVRKEMYDAVWDKERLINSLSNKQLL
jgi:uncharacterized protein